MHIGKNNKQHNYTMNSYETGEPIPLEKTELERDLGILLSKNLKFSEQANKAAANANLKLGLLRNTFRFRGAEMWKSLYVSYVRPHLEYAMPVWNPYINIKRTSTQTDINIIERIQRRATKIAHSLKGTSYVERCRILGLTDLQTKRKRGDLIQKYKIENKFDEIEWSYQPISAAPRGERRGQLIRELNKS
jgi:ribonucleases P/MRP protein subunit RPP40